MYLYTLKKIILKILSKLKSNSSRTLMKKKIVRVRNWTAFADSQGKLGAGWP
jgi:hypothetical protein